MSEFTGEGHSLSPLQTMRHSLAHIMAWAVKEIFPEAKLAIGPPIKDGFYYDFDLQHRLNEADLKKIEKKMHHLIRQNVPFTHSTLSYSEAIDYFSEQQETYKIEIIESLPKGEDISIYRNAEGFCDLCRGPHVKSTGQVGAYRLTSVAGAYWKGDENRPMLQRIYALAFETQEELNQALKIREEAKKRDHRLLGKELDLFSFQDCIGAGLVLFHPRGMTLRNQLVDYLREEHQKRHYQEVSGPSLMNADVWKTSGHYQMGYPMYTLSIDEKEYGIKPMNCPAHVLIYKGQTRSYRDLPLRYFEFGRVHRYEKSGVLHGLFRLRGFTQDDAHIFCTLDQVKEEIKSCIHFVEDVLKKFSFQLSQIEVSTQPEKSIGSKENWEKSTQALKEALKECGHNYEINEGDGAFYGPKIDFKLEDTLGRVWQCATIQCDFSLPERFETSYINSEGQKHTPVMIHRAIVGSLERFLGIVIENYSGHFPLWINPEQVSFLAIDNKCHDYIQSIASNYQTHKLRVSTDLSSDTIGAKIRKARMRRVPCLVIIGQEEMKQKTVSWWKRDGGNQGTIDPESLLKHLLSCINKKSISL